MKQLSIFFLAIGLLAGLTSCQTAEADSSGSETTEQPAVDNLGTTGTSAVSNQVPNAPPKPAYQQQAEELERTTVEFAQTEYNFGTVTAGEKVPHKFKFTNTGSSDFLVTNVKASCGCTTPDWTKTPIPPGESGYIDVVFNSAGRQGIQRKVITVTGNFDDAITRTLNLVGEVAKKE